jgi:BMFP domain-containing protein YqiC
MIDTKSLDELARKVAEAMPSGLAAFQKDLEKTLRGGLEGLFQRLDLVSREELEVQVALLRRTRDRLERLEARVHALEQASGTTQESRSQD